MISAIEYRVRLFHELHNNKWFHRMMHTLDELRSLALRDPKERFMLVKYGSCFYY
jgi:hypothetical protein